ncbi:MAG: C4-type zinc ribbon domain-containing protein, partial [Candidatus Bipolaricaulota bacterium]|nr:C4-type zinc ribbon domain-containing protein [Candidatus Bipolaricaulota bacterium]
DERLEELKHESRLKNHEVDTLDVQIHSYRKELKEAIISYKEMEALRVKISNQSERIDEMENVALSLMDQIEEMAVRLNKAKVDLSAREEKLNADCAVIVDRITQVKEGIERVERERAEIAAKIPSHLFKRYEHLHMKFSDPIVTINDGACSGCKLTVSGTTIGRVRSGLEIVSCENCSRVLYIP